MVKSIRLCSCAGWAMGLTKKYGDGSKNEILTSKQEWYPDSFLDEGHHGIPSCVVRLIIGTVDTIALNELAYESMLPKRRGE